MRCSAGKSSAGSVFWCALLQYFCFSDFLSISFSTSPASDQRGEICGGSGGAGGRNWNASCWIILENRRPGLFFCVLSVSDFLLISFFNSRGWRNLRRQRRGGRAGGIGMLAAGRKSSAWFVFLRVIYFVLSFCLTFYQFRFSSHQRGDFSDGWANWG